jgi:hypothetical protein
MGWAWSPPPSRLAQCLCWGLILGSTGKAKGGWSTAQSQKEATTLPHPPAFIYLRTKDGRIAGLIFCWYDNVTIVSYDDSVLNDVSATIEANRGHVDARWKEHITHDKLECATIPLEQSSQSKCVLRVTTHRTSVV